MEFIPQVLLPGIFYEVSAWPDYLLTLISSYVFPFFLSDFSHRVAVGTPSAALLAQGIAIVLPILCT